MEVFIKLVIKANYLAYIGGENQLFSLNCVITTLSCEKGMIFYASSTSSMELTLSR